MLDLIEDTRSILFSTPDTVCLERLRLVTEAYQKYESEPPPLRRALALEHVLTNMSLDLETNPFFAGNTSHAPRAWMLLPEYGFEIPGQALVENPRLAGLLDGDAIPPELRHYWEGRAFGGGSGIGHLAVDNRRLLAEGLDGIIAGVAAWGVEGQDGPSVYRRAMTIACRAVTGWATRYAQEAEIAAGRVQDPRRATALRRVARACRQVPAGPARNLFEALQSILLVHLAIFIEGHGYSVSPGRLDQVLMPYYRGEPDAVETIAAFLLALNANSLFGSHSKTQPITLGGMDAQGEDLCNPLTLLFLEACERARLPDPIVFLRWHRGLPGEVKNKALRMLVEGFSMPLLVGDDETIAGLENAGVSRSDAANYCIIGCNELGIPARLIWDAVTFPEAGLLREVLLDEAQGEPADMPALLDLLQARAHLYLRRGLSEHQAWLERSVQVVPTPFTSALMHGCAEAGLDLLAGMPIRLINLRSSGFTNAVNGLAAVAEVVYERQATSLDGLRRALRTDFQGCEPLRQALLHAPKWGNDDPRADRWAIKWLERRELLRQALQAELGFPLVYEIVVRSLHHLEGAQLGATPDGRRAGEALADSVGAQLGTARRGPTALLSSVCKMQPRRNWMGGYNLNLTLPYGAWRSAEMWPRLGAMVEAFFAGGGQELQIASLDAATLHDARRHPERYSGLLVRIAGFNARFVDLAETEQLELIARAEACEV